MRRYDTEWGDTTHYKSGYTKLTSSKQMLQFTTFQTHDFCMKVSSPMKQ